MKKKFKNANEMPDGRFTVDGKVFTPDEFKKLMNLQGGNWIIFVEKDSTFKTKGPRIDFALAM